MDVVIVVVVVDKLTTLANGSHGVAKKQENLPSSEFWKNFRTKNPYLELPKFPYNTE